ncbi:hypothetical protein EVA_12496 [gut metagenome]|uniref:Uncharacterized protein n=1 Tax=gut metagenome TaxID=749906 RepID=J9FWN4_9ZZZZ
MINHIGDFLLHTAQFCQQDILLQLRHILLGKVHPGCQMTCKFDQCRAPSLIFSASAPDSACCASAAP